MNQQPCPLCKQAAQYSGSSDSRFTCVECPRCKKLYIDEYAFRWLSDAGPQALESLSLEAAKSSEDVAYVIERNSDSMQADGKNGIKTYARGL
jgi:hypothetical protein